MNNYLFLICSCMLFSSCEYFTSEEKKTPVVRVNNTYLYQEDIRELLSENTSPEDSIEIVSNYINRWATQQLLIDQAKVNLSESQQKAYDRLVREYKNSLYTEGYKNRVVAQLLDTVVTQNQYETYYETHRENFKLNNELLKIRYIQLPPNYLNVAVTKQKLNRFSIDDKRALENDAIKYISLNLNDSIWVKKELLLTTLPALREVASKLKNNNNIEVSDSLGVYLLAVKDGLQTGDIAPLDYVLPTIRQIILNKRKLELVKRLETDITKDAIKNNDFETY